MLDLRGEKYKKMFYDTQFVKVINMFFKNKILSHKSIATVVNSRYSEAVQSYYRLIPSLHPRK